MANKIISGIYKIEDTVTGLVYVGSANQKSGIKKRWSNHLAKFRTNKYSYKELQDAWNIDENRIKFEILEICTDDGLLEERENYYIKYVSMIDGWTVINKQKKAKRASEPKSTSKMKKAQQGELNGHSSLTTDQVIEIKKMLLDGIKGYIIAKKYGVSGTQISRIKNEKRWANVKLEEIVEYEE